ncbi:cysteine synthase A [Maricaulis virginensis]|uniref:Cysteine synthase A n=1 Tax=Maricaulis virginensis TaxID=144022 RepID=A0A9W6MNH7_9PROT|nr:cysteine synthase A [Maricaulis virginensis]GLK51884.1 cysteine synthase A [Maricaulis virginensis]
MSHVLDLIGNTPLIRLDGPSKATGCEILGKAEFLNPGGSVKDRAALNIVREAEADGSLKPGGTIVEGTAGNTGIGLALVGGALGYDVIIVMPRTQSEEKKQVIRSHGARLIEVDAAPFSSPNHFVHYSRRLAEELNESQPHGAIWANQFDNLANRRAHEKTTGPEIWQQTGGKIDGFICAVGSGGTLAGVAASLRANRPDIAIGAADPAGAALYNYYTKGELKGEGSSITEGIGVNRITGNLEGLDVDHIFRIEDAEMLPILFELVKTEGLSLGGSAGINIAGAIRLARELGPGKTIVTMLCDAGSRYAGKLFNPEFLSSRGLPVPPWADSEAPRATA